MASLSAHLRRQDDHGRLRFHPDCPRCRDERLAGKLPAQPLISRRTQAAVTAGVLALTSAAPTAAFATEADQDSEGVAAVEQSVPDADSQFNPGGNSADLWTDAGAAPAGADAPAEDLAPSAPVTAAEPDAPAPAGASAPTEVEAVPAQPVAVTPPADAAPVAPSGAEAAAPAAQTKPEAVRAVRKEPRLTRSGGTPHEKTERARSASPAAASAPTVASAPPAAAPEAKFPQARTPTVRSAGAPASAGRAARPGDDAHMVLPGESLWSIADDLLGDGASPARVAREVNRLWRLNDDRIGTGNRDLLMAGTKLALT